MIIKIVGGVGNQLFQYAFALSLREKLSCNLRFDTSAFSNPKYYNPEGYLLKKIFNSPFEEISNLSLIKCFGVHYLPFVLRNRLPNFTHEKYIREKEIFKFQNFEDRDGYFEGHWQSYKYFTEYWPAISQFFDFDVGHISDSVLGFLDTSSRNSVCAIHVRRGDYVSHPVYSKMYTVLQDDYYIKAINTIKNLVDNVKFVVFSDDHEYVKGRKWFVESGAILSPCGLSSWEDLYLMSKCDHMITANSSFSWWGGWLIKNREKVVITAKNWFKDGTETPDLIPHDWMKL